MSLLEDVFLGDEATEAQELERVIDGDEYDDRPVSPTSDDNEEKDDEAVEDKRRVDPAQGKTKRVVKNPRFVLNPARLTGPRGIQVIPDHFKDFKFIGKGHEKEDLDVVLKKLEHWAYRLYPKFAFHDCLKKIETLGKKRSVMVHLLKIRSDQFVSEETVVQNDSSDDEPAPAPVDEFDKLLQQQIELARATPLPTVKKPGIDTPGLDRSHIMPKATSSPSISEEQRERMLRNRKLAEEKRLAKLRNDNSNEINVIPKQIIMENEKDSVEKSIDEIVVRKHNRSNVIDSSDDEEENVATASVTVDVDIHNGVENKTSDNHSPRKQSNETIRKDVKITADDKFDNLISTTEELTHADDINIPGEDIPLVENSINNDKLRESNNEDNLEVDPQHVDEDNELQNKNNLQDTNKISASNTEAKTINDVTHFNDINSEENKAKIDTVNPDLMDVDFDEDF